MIRKNIIKNKNDKQRYFLNDSWRIEMPAVVRTPFYGNNCSEYFGYVVTYSEMEQAYHLLKVDLHNGKILWSIDAVNGGYGTPTVFGDLVVFLKEFDAVQAVSAESGIVEWAVQGGHRVRTTLNVIDETLWFGSGSTLLAVNKNGEVVKKLHIPNSFIPPFLIRVWDIPTSSFLFSGKGPEKKKNPQVWLHLLCLLTTSYPRIPSATHTTI